jgi:hypothetical protein
MQTISFRVVKIRDLRSDFTRGHSHGRICIYATIFEQENKISSPEILHCYKSDEIHWINENVMMEWSRSHEEFQEMKASQPKIKFHVAVEAKDGEVTDIGFFTMDIRNIFTKENIEEVKIMNMHPSGAHVVIGSKLADQKTTVRSSMNEDMLRASIESTSSVLVIPPHYDSSRGKSRRYYISVRLEAFRNMAAALPPAGSGGFWFCWSVLDMTLQSAVYDGDISPTEDRLYVECSETALRNLLFEIGVLRIFLCSPGKILRVAEVQLFPAAAPSSRAQFPLQISGWSTLSSLDGGDEVDDDAMPSLFAAVEVGEASHDGSVPAPPPPPPPQTASNDEEEEENYYDEGEFEEHNPSFTTALQDTVEPNPQTMLKGTGENPHLISLSGPVGSANSQAAPTSLDDGESVYDSKHYRLCVQVKQLRDLDRAAHVSVQFAYPHLGISSSPVRTNGTWTSANSECLIEGAVASFDFGMIPSQLQNVLSEKKLVVQVLSRSQLGVDILGDATVDMSSLFSARTSHAYRCPLTGKQFQRLEHFTRHRHTMIALFSLGRVSQVPPHTPVVIRNIDMYVPILSGEKGSGQVVERGKMRVVLILEDMGLVTGAASSRFKARRGEDALLHMKTYEEGGMAPVAAGRETGSRAGRGAVVPPPPRSAGGVHDRGETICSSSEEEDIMRRLDWEEWRRGAEEKWMAALRQKEARLRHQLEEESAANLSQRADDLKRAQEEVGRLEVRLRSSIDLVERQKAQLELKEEQMNIRLAQKTDELQLLQRKIREEAKAKIDVETRRASALDQEVSGLQESLSRMEKRAKEAEKDYETYRVHVRAMPETSLREEAARLKAQVAELRGDVERERRLRSEVELEKEHYRSQMHRIAVALKREREKSAAVARQDLEQLRLEFLAREERCVLSIMHSAGSCL